MNEEKDGERRAREYMQIIILIILLLLLGIYVCECG